MKKYSAKKEKEIKELLDRAMNSDNSDYILEQLSKIYTIIFDNNIYKLELERELVDLYYVRKISIVHNRD